MMPYATFIPYLLVMAGVTYLIRMLPLAAVKGRIQSRFWQAFLHYIPYAVLGAMTFPAIFSSTGNFATSLIGMIAAIALGWMNKGLLIVAVTACAAAYLGGLVV